LTSFAIIALLRYNKKTIGGYMLLVFTSIVAGLLVIGQALWKSSAMAISNGSFSIINLITKVLLTPKFILGACLYVIATLAYVWLFSKFPYYAVQMSLVSFSLVFSFLISYFIFKESFSVSNFLGLALLIVGVILITWKN
jgi:drug/metabolite transporter (DMT)-like permease